MKKINVLLVDDHPMYREGVRNSILSAEFINDIAEANNGVECLKALDFVDYDLVLLDVSMPEMGGIECLELIKSRFPKVKVIMLTQFDQVKYFSHVMEIGAEGYLLKDVSPDELRTSIYKVCYEHMTVIASKVQAIFEQSQDKLSSREIDVLLLLCEGLSSQEIADKLSISVNTVNNHRSAISNRIGSRNLAGLFKWALNNDLVRLDE